MNLTTKTDTPETYFSRELLAWYRASKRTLPWRRDRDAYRIWVSEIMLQQTRVDTVIPYYERFMARFPTLQALAEAPEADVLKHWEGLGYYSRARNLQAGAREVAERYGGRVPDDKAAVSALKGVGPYTAGAIMSIAFNRPEPAVDGNVMRVLSRYFNRDEDIAKPSTRIGMEKLAASLIPDGAAGDFNQALMELGALVCTPRTPGCLTCPVMALCAGRIAGRETELPVKAKAKPPKPQLRVAAVIEGVGEHAGKVLVRQRPDSGLLASLWELPHVLLDEPAAKPRGRAAKLAAAAQPTVERQAADAAELLRRLEEETGLRAVARRWLGSEEHTFSHLHWMMRIYAAELDLGADSAREAAARLRLPAARGGASGSRVHGGGTEAAPAQGGPAGAERAAEAAALYGAAAASSPALPEGYAWIGRERMRELAFPNLFAKILYDYWDAIGEEEEQA
ncbi:A/G-specific adenine glycosylase [Paenibacillus pasadenensis]|uniref:Adenine DNA glycosylase n=1 Tax=Paenibacillus pasadenensis TaxID=217090 RepID=A0A2N5N2Z7_9BACL|nr:A/G-specific adenine glycosylase [Paenibacillus pasadenensis]PLT44699.1 A/G-specific adenine glycosylase [Paenibacillus pasadenensis]